MSTLPDVISEQECVTSPDFSEDSLALLYTGQHVADLRYTPELGKYHRLSRTDSGELAGIGTRFSERSQRFGT